MDFQLNEIKQVIAKLKPIVNGITPLADAKGILFKDGKLSALNYDLFAAIKVQTGLVQSNEAFIIPHTALDVIAKLTGDTVRIEYIDDVLHISCGKFKAKYATQPAEKFRAFEEADEVIAVAENMNCRLFVGGINKVLYATADDEKKGTLCGVNVVSDGTSITMTALDGFRAAQSKGIEIKSDVFNTTLGRSFCATLAKIAGDAENVRLTVLNRSVRVQDDAFEIKGRTLAGQYVDAAQIINSVQPDKSVVMDSEDIIRALELYASAIKGNEAGKNNLIRVKILPDGIVQFAARSELSQFTYEVGAECSGFTEVFEIGFNAKYIVQAVKALTGAKQILIKLLNPLKPALIYDNDKPDDALALVLPVKIG